MKILKIFKNFFLLNFLLSFVLITSTSIFAQDNKVLKTQSEEKKETEDKNKEKSKEKVIYSFTTKSTAEEINGKLKAGKKYILREKKAIEGYKKAKDIEFIVRKDGVEQEIKVINEKIKEDPKDKPKEEHKNGFAKTGISRNFIFSILILVSGILVSIIFYKKRKNQDN